MADGVRPYGPGKFSTVLDSYVYSVSLDGGCDEEEGDSDAGIWYGLMRNGRTIFKDHDPFLETLNSAEQEQLMSCAGVILYQDSNGFVGVTYYDTNKELNKAWADVVSEFAEPDEDEPNTISCDQCEMSSINWRWLVKASSSLVIISLKVCANASISSLVPGIFKRNFKFSAVI